MLLESLETQNFRNANGKIFCGRDLNIIAGDNGQGKTNWLEAIYLLATTKSFRTAKLQETILFDENLAIVRGSVEQSTEIRRTLQVALQANTKMLTLNGKREPVARYLGQLHAVVFTASELEVVRGTPDARRKFLDGGITAIYPAFVQTLADYNRVVKQKNSLLQSAQENGFGVEKTAELLEPWNEQLVNLSAKIHKARVRYVELLQNSLEKRLFDQETVTIRYVSHLENKGDLSDYKALLAERLKLRVQAETIAGHALLGTHRDDLEILFDNRDLRTFGSSGQQRSALLVLQLAAINLYYERNNEYPLFLLDDIDAELDKKRTAKLLEFLEGKTQTFLTTSKETLVEQFAHRAIVFQIANGAVVNSI